MVSGQRIVILLVGNAGRVFRSPTDDPLTVDLEQGWLQTASAMQRWDLRGRPLAGTDTHLASLPVVRTRWLGWWEFHPETMVWSPASAHTAAARR
jgi:hypothetical protein